MDDCRENLIRSISYIISQTDLKQSEMAPLRNKIITELSKYDVSERTTALATLDTASEAVIQLFLGTYKVEGKAASTIKIYG